MRHAARGADEGPKRQGKDVGGAVDRHAGLVVTETATHLGRRDRARRHEAVDEASAALDGALDRGQVKLRVEPRDPLKGEFIAPGSARHSGLELVAIVGELPQPRDLQGVQCLGAG